MENQGTPQQANNPKQGEDDFSQLLDQFQARVSNFEKDQLVSGRIIAITDREILVELGAKSEGIVSSRDVEALPKDVRSSLKVGDEVFAYVVQPEDQNGNVVLSMSRAVSEKDWRHAEELFEKQEAIEAPIAGFNKGGVIIKVGRLRGFVPASQLSLAHQRMLGDESLPPEQRFQKLVGQKALVKVIELDRERNRLILSERAASKEARLAQKEKLLSSIEVGQTLEGVVSSVKDFGVFVDLGGADGMIHLTELAHTRVKHPSEVVKEGDKVSVKVINIERETGRIGLSLKALAPDPWQMIGKKYKPGQLLEAEVIKVHPKHGVFARLKDDEAIEGLIPLSELSEKPVKSPREVVKEGQILTLRVLRVEPEQRRIALSLRRVNWPEYADTDWQAEVSSDDEGQAAVPDVVDDAVGDGGEPLVEPSPADAD
ncbi:MAG: 30S ribosomal protein S1 [Candidatus Roseilinea sp.]|nr:MAG: 30S ribosomal protein S1 [Candidatus Roseilinea sp.]